MTFDLGPAAARMADLVRAVPDAALDAPTPCGTYTVGDLLDHIGGCAVGFLQAATKTVPPENDRVQEGDAANLAVDWRVSIPAALDEMAAAWREPGAFDGVTGAGGLEMPAEAVAVVCVEELTVHGWDLARATGLPFEPAPADVDIALSFLEGFAGPESDDQRGPAFGPAIFLDDDAPGIDRAVALSGRDVNWTPA